MATRRNRIKGIANIPLRKKAETKPIDESFTNEPSDKKDHNEDVKIINKEEDCEKNNCNDPQSEIKSETSKTESVQDNPVITSAIAEITTKKEQSINPIPHRRTFVKPLVNIKSLTNKSKSKVEETDKSVVNLPQTPLTSVQPINNEIEISALPQVSTNPNSETIPEPQSPTKLLNRSRIKAVPRLTKRRISLTIHGSASESEDDVNKKTYKRIRTESVCSTVSNSNDTSVRPGPEPEPQKVKNFSTVIQRKCRRTEQSNKMAEARRNFVAKFRHQEPDKHKLTMLDLIFYNPTTKPMSQKSERLDIKKQLNDSTEIECKEDSVESDDENHIPAPQIKIGANGEIVVDEQSLIIENKQVKKDRENIQKSEIIDGDFDTGYGVYKRAKRSKDWSKEETLFFYKALNTIGTDFSLMVQLFPNRSRRELKMKFKKEEKINQILIDKALTRPIHFNIRDLKSEVETRQKIKEAQESGWEKRKTKEKNHSSSRGYKKKMEAEQTTCTMTTDNDKVSCTTDSSNDAISNEITDEDDHTKIKMHVKKGISAIWNSGSEDENSDYKDESDDYTSTADLSSILKPTRYGRIPKQKVFTLEDPKVVKVREEHMQDALELDPGSLMVVCCQNQTGSPTFKVFMITEAQNKVPVLLPSDVLTNITKSQDSVSNEKTIPESNYIICHDNLINKQIEVKVQDFTRDV